MALTTAIIISAILGLAGTVSISGVQAAISHYGASQRKRINALAEQIYGAIKNNSQLSEQLYDAYNQKTAGIANAIITSAGFGPQVISLRKELAKTKQDYQTKKSELTQKDTELNNAYNQLQSAGAYSGSSIAANKVGDDVSRAVEQQIQGGLINEKLS